MDDALVITDSEFRDAANLVYERFGISLTDQKRALVAGRLAKRVRTLGLPSFGAYLALVRSDSTGAELGEFINRISTNHSYFYREKEHFQFLLSTVMPKVKERLEKEPSYPFRIWCAGCAAGEEPYTLSMLVQESLGALVKKADWGILATDVSVAALSEAKAAIYPDNRIKELPLNWRNTYLSRCGTEDWTVSQETRKPILFKILNLMNSDYPFKGTFDIVFCRNVMIYFDGPTRRALVDRIYRYVKPGGYFFVGHSESLPRDTCPFSYVNPATYRKAEGSRT